MAARYDHSDDGSTHWVKIKIYTLGLALGEVVEDFEFNMFFDDPGYAKALAESINSAADFKEVEAA